MNKVTQSNEQGTYVIVSGLDRKRKGEAAWSVMICRRILVILILQAVTASVDAAAAGKAGLADAGSAGARSTVSGTLSTLPIYDAGSYDSLAAACADIGTADAVLVVSKQFNVPAPTIIQENIRVRFTLNGHFVLARNATVRMSLPVTDGPKRIFTGTGQVTFNRVASLSVVPQWWGAQGDGTTDDTTSLQQAIDAVARSGGGTVLLSSGAYVADNLVLDSQITLVGEGKNSILKQKRGSRYCVSINPGSGGTPRIEDNKHDIGIRSVHFRGTVERDGFQEHTHLLNINAATRVVIADCLFTGWRGDAIYIGSSNTARTERHNKSITVERCTFDGIANDNRNAVTIIDGDGVVIRDSTFMNCTRQNMPGAIDIEPNANTFAVINGIRIMNNTFRNIGGNGGVIAVVLPRGQQELNIPARDIIIEGNTIGVLSGSPRTANGIFLYQMQSVTDATPENTIVIARNAIRASYRPFRFFGVKGVRVERNLFERSSASALVAYKGRTYKCQDIEFLENVFKELGTVEGTGISIFDIKDVRFLNNTFEDVGPLSGSAGYALRFREGTTERIMIRGNTFRGARTTAAVRQESLNITTPADNIIMNNVFEWAGKGNFPGI